MQMNGDGLAPVVGSFVMDTFRWMTTRGNSFASVYGLAFSTSISFVVEAVLGIWLLSRKLKVFSFKETVMPLFPMILNSAITSAAMYVMFKLVDQFLNTEKTLFVVLLSGLVFLYGGVVYAIGSKVFRIKEFDYIFNEATKLLSSIVGRVGRPMKHVEEK
jgi:peptidoglycan biosynthesis protein MviN/MurJ (putative lipid II flippase)